jgi:hypothetical protein
MELRRNISREEWESDNLAAANVDPATAGEARERGPNLTRLTDEQIVDRLVATARTNSDIEPTYNELLRRLRRGTPAAEPGMVTIPLEDAKELAGLVRNTMTNYRRITARATLDAAIAAADPAPGEGENEDDIVTTGHWMDKPEGFSP